MFQYRDHDTIRSPIIIANFNNNTNSANVLYGLNSTYDDSDILEWLYPQNHHIWRHQGLRASRLDSVGGWILQTEQYQSWYDITRQDNSNPVALFYYCVAGVGKTYISSVVIDDLCDQARGQDIIVAYFYLDFESPTSVLSALLKQVVQGLNEIPDSIRKAYEDQKKPNGGRGLRLPDITGMLQTILSTRRAFLCIDALDKCAPEDLLKLLSSLREVLQKSPGTRLFLTGRPDIQREIQKSFGESVAAIAIAPPRGDVLTYIDARLDEDPFPEEMDGILKADITTRILEKFPDILLVVSLKIDEILREPTIDRRRRKLNSLTGGLGSEDAYDETLKRIMAQGGEGSGLGMIALKWVCCSERPLQSDELCHAVAIEIGSTNLDSNNVPSIWVLLGYCQGLFCVDKESSTVRLIHPSLREYFSSRPDLVVGAHATIAESCLEYLNSQQIKALSVSSDLRDAPFLKYSSRYWGAHAKKELSDRGKFLALELFDQHDHIFTRLLLAQVGDYEYLTAAPLSTALHYAAFFGIVEIATALIEKKSFDINQRDLGGVTPLIWAAENGHEEMVELLLNQEDVNPDKPDEQARTPLSRAAQNGNEAVVRLLLKMENVDPNKPEESGRTALSRAAENGHEGVVKLLLGRDDINPGKPEKLYDQTPLSWAAENGHEGVVRLLLEREDVSDKPDKLARTALSRAAENGHKKVVELLLKRKDVGPDIPDDWGRTPLSRAATNGHGEVVRLLLQQKDVYPDKSDEWGRTPLSWAAGMGHERVVELLLKREDINPDAPDGHGQTPLSWAAERGHQGVVKLLLAREDVDPLRPDDDGQTPLTWADDNGHDAVVKLLSGREPSGREPSGREPSGRESPGREPSGRESSGRESSRRESPGREPSGQEPSGRESSGREPSILAEQIAAPQHHSRVRRRMGMREWLSYRAGQASRWVSARLC